MKYFIRLFIKFLPDFRFPRFTVTLFNYLGYTLSKSVRISNSSNLIGNVKIKIGRETYIGHNTLITGGESTIHIGSYCDISSNVTIISGSHNIDPMGKRIAGKGFSKDIFIEDGVWVGAAAIILGGVRIGSNSVIAAGSVVIKNVPAFTIVGGNPAKPLKVFNVNTQVWERI